MITFDRLFCDRETDDPYEGITWVREDTEIQDADGNTVFSQDNVEFPITWSQRARNIVASKYFYGSGEERESSLKQIIDRVVDTLTAEANWLFGSESLASKVTKKNFSAELKSLLVNQYASFNSPVWFNIGVEGVRQQGSACFINHVEDDMDSILELSMAEGQIFKRGSGAGVNLSRLRGKGEPLSGGGTSSGPVSFMKGLDAQAGIIKSGGVTRRAAKMVLMDVDHPDIMEFIRCKQEEERKAKALIDAGYDSAIDGEAYGSVFFQNANHSVRLTDDFIWEAIKGKNCFTQAWKTRNRVDDEEHDVIDGDGALSATDILREIAETAWACGDPGIQFTDTINTMHTCIGTDAIYASNPCSEFVFLDNTACNLASINVLKYWDGASFDWKKLLHTVHLLIFAQEILVGYSDYPTADIQTQTVFTRPLGLGIANLGALLMTMGLPYDSDEGRDFAAAIMAVITGEAYYYSAILARELGPFRLYDEDENGEYMLHVIAKHKNSAYDLAHKINLRRPDSITTLPTKLVSELWEEAAEYVELVWEMAHRKGKEYGFRNAQVTVIAPTGTISFMMDCDTTGVEPLLAPTTIKSLVGGGQFVMLAKCFEDGKRLVHDMDLEKRHYPTHKEMNQHPILATALGDNALSPEAHLKMLEAVQPFVSGAISKTINMPADSTVEDVEDIIIRAWYSDVKCIAIYRDGSKGSQPMKAVKEEEEPVSMPQGVSNIAAALGRDSDFMDEEEIVVPRVSKSITLGPTTMKIGDTTFKSGPYRRKLDRTRPSVTHKFDIGGHEGYLTLGLYKDGDVAELFVNMAKEGSTISGLLGQWAMTLSLALQYGVPLNVLIDKHSYVRYEPSGFTGDEDVKNAYSITDYIMRWIKANKASFKEGKDLGKVPEQNPTPMNSTLEASTLRSSPPTQNGNGNVCTNCNGILMVQGNCHVCSNCGESTGCG